MSFFHRKRIKRVLCDSFLITAFATVRFYFCNFVVSLCHCNRRGIVADTWQKDSCVTEVVWMNDTVKLGRKVIKVSLKKKQMTFLWWLWYHYTSYAVKQVHCFYVRNQLSLMSVPPWLEILKSRKLFSGSSIM